ncbi:glypican-6 [Condylostylus longicornis]|uniref:glypican-6 n=1 Tax=Condylostylus longicornis TaxID=2530218 RepID=UPI00244DE096|nr:glypican-6 [Condylostylus longicornis]
MEAMHKKTCERKGLVIKLFGILRYCEIPPSGTCCTYFMEGKLAVSSRLQLERNVKDSLGKLSSVLGTRAMKFNSEFATLLATSKKEFHTMFKRTYGVIYEQNAYVFADLFAELEKYYTRGRVNLSEAIDTFFNTLYQKMFTVLNAQYQFNDKYLGCVSEHMRELKPFGDVPDKLSVQIKRSFVATRTYAQAVITASEIVKKVANTRVYSECTAALTKMQQCGICKGHSEKPCNAYCVNVMKGCLQHFNELDTEWDNFVAAIVKLSERLLGPFNIVMVVEPINIKISEAIMNFQETGQDISNQVFTGCGRPTLGRKRRNLYSDKIAISNNESDILDIDAQIEDEVITDSNNNNNNNNEHRLNKRSPISEMDQQQQQQNDQEHQEQLQQEHQSEQSLPSSLETQGGGGGRNKNKKSGKKIDDDEMDNREPDLDKLVKDIREKVKESKKFWSNLAYHLCNNEDNVASPKDDRCWNGTTVDRYRHPIVLEQSTNPEFPSNQNFKPNNVIVNQLYYLKTTVNHLKNAFNGLDVDWSDQEEPDYENGSGSGDGIGSDDEDDDEDNIHGSGSHGYDDNHSTIGPTGSRDGGISIDHGGHGGTGTGTQIHGNHDHTYNSNTNRKDETSTKKSITQSNNENETYKHNKANSSTKLKAISLIKAIVMYLFPIYMAWFGGIFTELL